MSGSVPTKDMQTPYTPSPQFWPNFMDDALCAETPRNSISSVSTKDMQTTSPALINGQISMRNVLNRMKNEIIFLLRFLSYRVIVKIHRKLMWWVTKITMTRKIQIYFSFGSADSSSFMLIFKTEEIFLECRWY